MATTGHDGSEGVFAPGSPEDVMQILQNLNHFFSNKIKAIELYRQGGNEMRAETSGTRSVCHIDGVDDGDSWGAAGAVSGERKDS